MLTNKKFYTLDVKNDFHHIVLDEASSKLLRFNIPFRIYKCKG